MRRQTRNGQMAETHRDLAPVLEANRTAGLGATGLADLVGYRFADVTVSGRARHVPGNVSWRTGACCGGVSPVNRRFQGPADVWGGVARDAAPLQGMQCQLRQPATL